MTAQITQPVAAQLWRGLDEVPAGFGPSVVTLGVFDGVHRGHARLIRQAVRAGHTRGVPTVMVTFDPHPAAVLGLKRDTAALSTVERRAKLAFQLGVRAVCVLEFTRDFAALPPSAFVESVLVEKLRAAEVVVGANFTFGHRAAGSVGTLAEAGREHGFTACGVDLLHEDDIRCSSSYIRSCLRCGDVVGAARVLGRPHRVEGVLQLPVPGEGELLAAARTALPAPGRYLGKSGADDAVLRVTGDGRLFVAARGLRPGPCGVDFLARGG